MIPNSYKLIRLNGFIPIPPNLQLMALLFVLIVITIITLFKEIL